MARHKHPFRIQLEFVPLSLLFGLISQLPLLVSRILSRALFAIVLAVMPKRRRLVDEQLAQCFPHLAAPERQDIARRSMAHLTRGLAVYPRIPFMTRAALDAIVEVEGFEHIEEALLRANGVITFTAHYGFWELMAIYVTHLYPKIAMVVRPLDNPLLDRMVTRVRGSGGGGVIDSRKVLREGMRLLRDNGILGVLIDQNFHKGGVFVNFFGRPAATNTLVPILARRTGCAVLPMHNVWRGEKIRIICEPPVTLSSNPDQATAIQEDTQKLTGYVERWIREDPSQWLWLHNRWKRRPLPEEVSISS